VVALLLVLSVVVSLGAQSRVTLSVGHSGEVRDIAGRADLDRSFSVGTDGKLLVWDLEHEGLRRSWQISHDPVTRIAVHPERTEITVFVQEGLATGRLIGLNWETGDELFSVQLDATPDYLDYSPQGTYLVYTIASFDSVYFLDGRDGSPEPFLQDGFGMVSFVQMAPSERNVMTYVPSRGEFIYWRLRSGSELQTVSTARRLDHLTLVDEQTQRFLAGAGNDELVVVDNVTGDTVATYPVAPIHDITYDPVSERILVLTDQLDRRRTLAFRYDSGRLRRDYYRPQSLADDTAVIAPVGAETRGFAAGSERGEVAFYRARTGRRIVLGPPITTPITDLGLTPGKLHLGAGNTIVSITSNLFDEDQRSVRADFVRESRVQLPDFQQLRFVTDRDRLLLWGSDEPGSLYELLPPSETPQLLYDDELDAPIVRVRSTSAGPLVIHRDGRLIQLAAESGVERFQYTAVGAQDALWDEQLGFVAAKTRTTSFDSSLIVVDQLTGETVTAETDAFLTTDIVLDPESTQLYAIGLHGRHSSPQTRLLRLAGRGLATSTVLESSDDELSRGGLLWDARTESLLSSMEYRSVVRYRDGRREPFANAERLHGELTAGGAVVAARNLDGTATLWNRATGELLLNLYVLDGEWIAIGPEGTYLSQSPRPERQLTFLPASRSRLDVEDFRIDLPFER
jgi:WD40 repeat protein